MGFVKYMSGIMVENPLLVGGFLYELSLKVCFYIQEHKKTQIFHRDSHQENA